MLVAYLHILLGEMSVEVFCPFFNRVVIFLMLKNCSVGCLCVLSLVSFAVKKFLGLIRPHLFILAFISFAVGDRSKKYCYNLYQRMFCLINIFEG